MMQHTIISKKNRISNNVSASVSKNVHTSVYSSSSQQPITENTSRTATNTDTIKKVHGYETTYTSLPICYNDY